MTKSFADKHNVKSVQDIVAKNYHRIAINRRGNMDADVGEAAMNLLGISRKNVNAWGGQVVHAASKEIVSLVSDRRLDVVLFGISFNHPRVREIAKSASPVLLSYGKENAEKVAKKFGGEVCQVKPGEYKWSAAGNYSYAWEQWLWRMPIWMKSWRTQLLKLCSTRLRPLRISLIGS